LDRTPIYGRAGKVAQMHFHYSQLEHRLRHQNDTTLEETRPEGPTDTVREQVELKFTNDVVIVGRHFAPEIRIILDGVMDTAPEMTDDTVWVTSAWRADDTKHGTGEAFDIRIKNVKGFNLETFAYNKIVAAWVKRVKERLGPDYDVIYGNSKHLNHFHVEYDPKDKLVILTAER